MAVMVEVGVTAAAEERGAMVVEAGVTAAEELGAMVVGVMAAAFAFPSVGPTSAGRMAAFL